jgi:hypothetical protein
MLELQYAILGLLILLLFVLPPSLFPPAFIGALLLYNVLVIEQVIRVIGLQEPAICFGCL